MLGFFGAAGLSLPAIEAAIDRLARNLTNLPYGFNLIHSPNEPDLEQAVVDLFLKRNVRLVEASAYLDLTLPIVQFRVHGIRRDPDGRVFTPNKVIAKVSRVEVASKFMSPPPPPVSVEPADAAIRLRLPGYPHGKVVSSQRDRPPPKGRE